MDIKRIVYKYFHIVNRYKQIVSNSKVERVKGSLLYQSVVLKKRFYSLLFI